MPPLASLLAPREASPPLTDRVVATRAVAIAMICLVNTVCGLRLYLRAFVLQTLGLDDLLVVIALILVNGFSALGLIITFHGLGYHQKDVSPEQLQIFMKIQYAANVGYLWVALAVKTSLIAFILRVFPGRKMKICAYILIGFMVAFTVSNFFAFVFQCVPINQFWLRTQADACFTPDATFDITLFQGVVMFACDLVIIAMPVTTIWKLQMSLKKRLLAIFLFSFGIVACAAALVRFTTLPFAKDTVDQTYSAATSLIWMLIEFNFGLLAGSISSLRQLFKIRSILKEGSSNGYTPHSGSERNEYELSNGKASVRTPKRITKTSTTVVSYEATFDREGSRDNMVVPQALRDYHDFHATYR